jgi:hypothetical protein
VLREITLSELMRFRIGLDGLQHRPIRPGDGVTAVVAEPDFPLIASPDATFSTLLARASVSSIIAVGRPDFLRRLEAAIATDILCFSLPIPETPFLLDPMTRIGVKMALNALSTTEMTRLGRVLGNRMIWVVPSNLKLIDRATRYVRDLAGVSYEDACLALFEAIDYVDPRRRAGQAYPAPVGLAVMRLRHGLAFPDAEARLAAELV